MTKQYVIYEERQWKIKKVEEVKIALIDLESEMQILQDAYANEDDAEILEYSFSICKVYEPIKKFINEVMDSSVSNANNKNLENLKEAFIDLGYEIEELQEACSANDDEAIKENLATLFKAYEMLNKHISIIKL